MQSRLRFSIFVGLIFLSVTSYAKVEIKDGQVISEDVDNSTPKDADRKPALKFFGRKPASSAASGSSRAHFLGLHLGGFVNSESFKWGVKDKDEDNGKVTVGVDYRLGEWTDTMDLLIRIDFNSYELTDGKPLKMSIIPMAVFPEATSKFPLYFGIGLGPGVFFKQIAQESALALDYQLVAGFRMFDVFENTGFSFEMGMKNHLQLLSDGQFNGVFAAAGVVFTF